MSKNDEALREAIIKVKKQHFFLISPTSKYASVSTSHPSHATQVYTKPPGHMTGEQTAHGLAGHQTPAKARAQDSPKARLEPDVVPKMKR